MKLCEACCLKVDSKNTRRLNGDEYEHAFKFIGMTCVQLVCKNCYVKFYKVNNFEKDLLEKKEKLETTRRTISQQILELPGVKRCISSITGITIKQESGEDVSTSPRKQCISKVDVFKSGTDNKSTQTTPNMEWCKEKDVHGRALRQNKKYPENTGIKYLSQSKFKPGFRYYLKKRIPQQTLRQILMKETRKSLKSLARNKKIPWSSGLSLDVLRRMSFMDIIELFKEEVPFLYDMIVASLTPFLRSYEEICISKIQSVLGFIFSIIAFRAYPLKSTLVQKMNSIQMWRAGCKRSLLTDFSRLGICVVEKRLQETLNSLKETFDEETKQWMREVQVFVYGHKETPSSPSQPAVDKLWESVNDVSKDQEEDLDEDSEWEDAEDDSEEEAEETDDHAVVKPIVGKKVHNTVQCKGDMMEYQDVNEDSLALQPEADRTEGVVVSREVQNITCEVEETAPEDSDAAKKYPSGYTLCVENIGKTTLLRNMTRDLENKNPKVAAAYAVKNRIPTTDLDDTDVRMAKDIDLDTFILSDDEQMLIRDRLVNMVSRIIKRYITAAQNVQIEDHYTHKFEKESSNKSEMCNLGVMEGSPTSMPEVLKMIEKLHDYVPTDGTKLHKLITLGDTSFGKYHVEAQQARANSGTPLTRLAGLEPFPQEFDKRMLLIQDIMDQYYYCKSSMAKGTLAQLRNLLNLKAVSRNVPDMFNHVADFLKFVTECYVIAFAMKILCIEDFDDVTVVTMKDVIEASQLIVTQIWCPIEVVDEESAQSDTYCFCQQTITDEDDDEPMIECEGIDCQNGKWFHFACVNLSAEEIPEGSWYCSHSCEQGLSSCCWCKRNKDEAMVECSNSDCPNGSSFHASCVGLTDDELPIVGEPWYCTKECMEHKKRAKRTIIGDKDLKYAYTQRITWAGLNDLIRRDAILHNDGPMMILYWKADLAHFYANNHRNHLLMGHRLIASVNGWVSERLRTDLVWNRTLNLTGGIGCNDEAGRVKTILDQEFKDSLCSCCSKVTTDTSLSYGSLPMGIGKELQKLYAFTPETSVPEPPMRKASVDRTDDMRTIVGLIRKEKLTEIVPGRAHKTFQRLSKNKISKTNFLKGMKDLSKRLDRYRAVTAVWNH
ncbi:uncharacterized protein LOC128207930 [Mya arenaria]|uniref:uncharacterized protein LOC128207930 n=1 Tax=Mya arenaria TaxID=6604 RepID=UPI0022E8FC91|nr:uncharacterized protein LOC128207930 [Mya arenaria]